MPLVAPSDVVVVDDVELGQDVGLGRVDPGEEGLERRVAVHQQLDVVAAREGERGHLVERPHLADLAGVGLAVAVGLGAGGEEEGLERPLGGPLEAVRDAGVELAERREVVLELGPPEDPVEGERDEGERRQREHPRRGALRRPRVHDGVDGGADAGEVEHGDARAGQSEVDGSKVHDRRIAAAPSAFPPTRVSRPPRRRGRRAA